MNGLSRRSMVQVQAQAKFFLLSLFLHLVQKAKSAKKPSALPKVLSRSIRFIPRQIEFLVSLQNNQCFIVTAVSRRHWRPPVKLVSTQPMPTITIWTKGSTKEAVDTSDSWSDPSLQKTTTIHFPFASWLRYMKYSTALHDWNVQTFRFVRLGKTWFLRTNIFLVACVLLQAWKKNFNNHASSNLSCLPASWASGCLLLKVLHAMCSAAAEQISGWETAWNQAGEVCARAS